ncbi:MAG: 6-phosphogluconolactonase [Variibacter sp.]
MATDSVAAALQRPRQIIIVDDPAALAQAAARRLIERLSGERPAYAVCLTGGTGPLGLFHSLTRAPFRDAIPWRRVHWFIGDERFVPPDDPLNNMRAARQAFLDRLAPPENIHPIDTTAGSPDVAARRYERLLQARYGADRLDRGRPLFDLVLMGLGGDGHTASLFPGAPGLLEPRRWVIGVEHAQYEPFVPRVTLTLPALASTYEMLFLVGGAAKHDILARVLAGSDLPASRAYANGSLVWLVDRAAMEGAKPDSKNET